MTAQLQIASIKIAPVELAANHDSNTLDILDDEVVAAEHRTLQ